MSRSKYAAEDAVFQYDSVAIYEITTFQKLSGLKH